MLVKSIAIATYFVALCYSVTVTVISTRDFRVGSTPTIPGQNTVEVTITRSRNPTTSLNDSPDAVTSLLVQTTAITSCHFHDSTQFCIDGNGIEGSVVPAPTKAEDAPTSYTGCHTHGEDTFCLDSSGREVQFIKESASSTTSSASSSKKNCHFHAGVEHCVGEGETENKAVCERVDRDYNIPLRIGLLFVILITSGIGSFSPILLNKIFKFREDMMIPTLIKQFGTGIIISTAFVHLITHANLLWGNSCITLAYESTGTSITMAAIFLAFLVEYGGNRLIQWRQNKILQVSQQVDEEDATGTSSSDEKIGVDDVTHLHGLKSSRDKSSVMLLEAGIVFHSILIGITLVVAGDSYFITLFIVILFHQMFEGLALGAIVSELQDTKFFVKLILATIFAIVTPIGMAIGIGTLKKFNGNDPSTIIVLGTLDSISAGILIWTGLIEMWAHDWLFGHLASASLIKTTFALITLAAGLSLMSVLGRWA